MKNKFLGTTILFSILLFSAVTGSTQNSKKVIAVINKADWCHVCQANGEKIMKEVIPVFNESSVQFLMNDLTSDATKADSKMGLDKIKVYEAVKKIKETGLLLLIDAETGKLLEKISVAEPVEKLVKTIKQSSMVEKM